MFSKKQENFYQSNVSNVNAQPNLSVNPNLYKNQADILYDSLFQDITVYNNDLNPYASGEETGLEKCLTQCPTGTCVEFGQTGIAWGYNCQKT